MKLRAAWMLALWCAGQVVCAAEPKTTAGAWPAITQTAKPWTRWWWPGSAVTRDGITKQLEAFAAAGIGGVEITPIYGAKGAEAQYLEFLSPAWVQMLGHTVAEANRLGLGVDMATGTGWPFGGPRVAAADGSSTLALADGRLIGKPTEMKVKRPAPGGEGLVLDPYSPEALDRYLQPFTQALAALPHGAIRSQFHDSFEYYNSSWSPGLPAKFLAMHGYDIQQYAAELTGAKPLEADTLARIKGDYRRTLAQMHLDYVWHWVRWTHERGSIPRNQAHGAPGNLLDLYAVAGIAETESFGATALPIPGLRQDAADVREDPDPPIGLIGRFASSATHVTARALTSSESLTWLRENFRESPAAAKPQLDRLFIAGINHIFYHGTSYSPPDAAWPGWFFYAATQLKPENPLWRDFQAMHGYVARVQSVLQQGRPDNTVLLYWPQADVDDDASGLMRQYGMHENEWLKDSHAGRLALQLLEAGYSFDLISDAQLRDARVYDGKLLTAQGARYDLVVVPKTRRMPVETLSALSVLANNDARVVFEALPEDVPGLGGLAERRAEFRRLLGAASIKEKVRLVPDLVKDLDALGGRRETLADLGLWYTRRARDDGGDYFVVNLTGKSVEGWATLNSSGRYVAVMDALSGDAGLAPGDPQSKRPRVYLQLASGQSLVLRTFAVKPTLARWRRLERSGEVRDLAGPWSVEFVSGGPELPRPVSLPSLASWTTFADAAASRFSGTARYRIEFDRGRAADEWLLDLGDVRETARVTLNGKYLGTVWSLPAQIRLGGKLRRGRNELEIEVTNLPANRVRDLDLRKVGWKIMNDINLASLKYRALDASVWEPQPSGLLGPVRLVPMKLVSQAESPTAP